jgi:hypothetical protein
LRARLKAYAERLAQQVVERRLGVRASSQSDVIGLWDGAFGPQMMSVNVAEIINLLLTHSTTKKWSEEERSAIPMLICKELSLDPNDRLNKDRASSLVGSNVSEFLERFRKKALNMVSSGGSSDVENDEREVDVLSDLPALFTTTILTPWREERSFFLDASSLDFTNKGAGEVSLVCAEKITIRLTLY